MKFQVSFLMLTFFLFSAHSVRSQSNLVDTPVIPIKTGNTVLFGKDIIIDDLPAQDQGNVCVCSAFNGWLYALYAFPNASQGHPGIKLFKSVDHGISWTVIYEASLGLGAVINSSDIVVCGNSVSNLKLFFVYVISSDQFSAGPVGYIRFSGETGAWEYAKVLDSGFDVSIASDFMYPATNSNPFSIGILYSKDNYTSDSIVFITSGNGGINFDNRKVLAGTANKFHKVALAYGRSLSQPGGRYYALWEEKVDYTSNTGHIYTSHSEPNFNSPFTSPVMIDNLDPASLNMVKNPAIACQYNNIDNDSSNITQVILYDKYIQATGKYTIDGFYNMRSTSSNNFQHFTLNASSESKQQSSIKFNPFDSTFMVTCYDSTTQKLPYYLHNFNMINPDFWQVISSGYNDSNNLVAPYPKVSLDWNLQKGINVWTARRTGGNGMAMFDATYSTWTGMRETGYGMQDKEFRIFPNPCSDFLSVNFELKRTGNVKIVLNNLLGSPLRMLTDQTYSADRHLLRCNLSDFPSGTYLISIISGNHCETIKLLIFNGPAKADR